MEPTEPPLDPPMITRCKLPAHQLHRHPEREFYRLLTVRRVITILVKCVCVLACVRARV